MFRPSWLTAVFSLILWISVAVPARGQDGSNVLLVVNDVSADSRQIATHYAAARHVPPENVLSLSAPTAEEIERSDFSVKIEQPIAHWLTRYSAQDKILYLVLTKGIPLRIRGTAGQTGTVASVDSELTLLYRKLLGIQVPLAGPVPNPYFQGDRPLETARNFSHSDADIFLVSRLDGFTLADVLQLIDRGAAPVRDGDFLLDERASLFGERSGDTWLAEAAAALTAKGLGDRVVLNTTGEVLSERKHVLGYYSWGSNDPAIKRRRFDFGFVPGSLAAMFVSSDARTFKEPPSSWTIGSWSDTKTFFEGSPQSLIGDLIREGATGLAGHVAEPYLIGTIRPQILFPAYVAGFNLVESFYLAMPYLSWQTVVVGDPLCSPFRRAGLSSDLAAPKLDVETQTPPFFAARRLAITTASGIPQAAAKLLMKGDARLAAGDRAGAQDAFENAVKLEPRLTMAQLALATLYTEAGDYDKAIERYRAVVAITPNEFVSLNNLAFALAVNKGAPAEALPFAQRAYQIASASANVIDTLGWIHHLLGNETEAARLLAEATKTAPGNPAVRLHLAVVYEATNQRELAQTELAKAVELDPGLETTADVTNLRSMFRRPAGSAPAPRR
jgi:uncharacterized protein (TIGR03790 family)